MDENKPTAVADVTLSYESSDGIPSIVDNRVILQLPLPATKHLGQSVVYNHDSFGGVSFVCVHGPRGLEWREIHGYTTAYIFEKFGVIVKT